MAKYCKNIVLALIIFSTLSSSVLCKKYKKEKQKEKYVEPEPEPEPVEEEQVEEEPLDYEEEPIAEGTQGTDHLVRDQCKFCHH